MACCTAFDTSMKSTSETMSNEFSLAIRLIPPLAAREEEGEAKRLARSLPLRTCTLLYADSLTPDGLEVAMAP